MAKKPLSIGVIGNSDAVLAFRTLGMRVLSVQNAQQASQAVFKLVSDGIPVIFITEDIARLIPETMSQYDSDPHVSLIPIPGSRETTGLGMERLHSNVEKAVGANILLNNMEE